jgi:chlorobactene glucosyltransferase
LSVLLLIALSNLHWFRRVTDYSEPPHYPFVSILVPARNEESNIESCVCSLLAQDYPCYQIIVLDDDSSDGTGQVLAALVEKDSRMRAIAGKPLPEGWLGKPWACHQLWQAADGDLLLFTDADTRHNPRSVRDAVSALLAEGADLLSVLPQQETGACVEKLLVPLIPWSILSFAPLVLVNRAAVLGPSPAVGQFMLFRRETYAQVGGHAAVRGHAAEDLALGRRIKASGFRLCVVDGGQRVRVRMYCSSHEAYEGFSKNLFAAFDYRIFPFSFVWLWLGFVFFEPLAVLSLAVTGLSSHFFIIALAVIAIAASLLLWGITVWRFRFPFYLAFLYPVSILAGVIVAFRSMVLTLMGRTTWKGRTLPMARER